MNSTVWVPNRWVYEFDLQFSGLWGSCWKREWTRKKKSLQQFQIHPICVSGIKIMSLLPVNVHVTQIHPWPPLSKCVFAMWVSVQSVHYLNLMILTCSPWSCPASVQEVASFLVYRTEGACRWCWGTGQRSRCPQSCLPSPPSWYGSGWHGGWRPKYSSGAERTKATSLKRDAGVFMSTL